MQNKVLNPYELLELMAHQQAVTSSAPTDNNTLSRWVRVEPDSWQANIFRQNPSIRHVTDVADLHAALADPRAPILFIGDDVLMSAEAISRACSGSGNDKIILWEDAGL